MAASAVPGRNNPGAQLRPCLQRRGTRKRRRHLQRFCAGSRRRRGGRSLTSHRMGGADPVLYSVARQTEARTRIINDQKVPELIIVRVVASGALKPAVFIQSDRSGAQGGRVFNPRIFRGQGEVINERNGMVPGQIRAKVSRASGHRRYATPVLLHRDGGRAAADVAQRHSAIVTPQAKTRRPIGLRNRQPQFIQRAAAIHNIIADARKTMIPQRRGAISAVDGMAEDANIAFGRGLDGAGPGSREIVYRINNALGVARPGQDEEDE